MKSKDRQMENELRVTDRRRITLDADGAEHVNEEAERPSLKPTYVEELEARTKAAEKQVQEVQARFDQLRQQLQRETDETRQRLNRSADERSAGHVAKFISSLLPVMDDLNRAIDAASGDETPQAPILDGLRRIAASFQSALVNAGVEPIVSVGEQFDPELHEAVDTEETSDMDGKVIAEYSRGYRLGDRLLRPARVKVGRASQQARQSV